MPLSLLAPRGEREKISGGCGNPTSKSGTRNLLKLRRSLFDVQCSMFALSLMNDFRFAFRQLLKNPGFTVVAVLTLALGIGANTSMFSMLNVALFPRLPYPDSGRLVRVFLSSS